MCCELGVNEKLCLVNMEAEVQYTEDFRNGWQSVPLLCLGYTGSRESVKQHNYIPHIRSQVRRKRRWNTTLIFSRAAGLLKLHTLFDLFCKF